MSIKATMIPRNGEQFDIETESFPRIIVLVDESGEECGIERFFVRIANEAGPYFEIDPNIDFHYVNLKDINSIKTIYKVELLDSYMFKTIAECDSHEQAVNAVNAFMYDKDKWHDRSVNNPLDKDIWTNGDKLIHIKKIIVPVQ